MEDEKVRRIDEKYGDMGDEEVQAQIIKENKKKMEDENVQAQRIYEKYDDEEDEKVKAQIIEENDKYTLYKMSNWFNTWYEVAFTKKGKEHIKQYSGKNIDAGKILAIEFPELNKKDEKIKSSAKWEIQIIRGHDHKQGGKKTYRKTKKSRKVKSRMNKRRTNRRR